MQLPLSNRHFLKFLKMDLTLLNLTFERLPALLDNDSTIHECMCESRLRARTTQSPHEDPHARGASDVVHETLSVPGAAADTGRITHGHHQHLPLDRHSCETVHFVLCNSVSGPPDTVLLRRHLLDNVQHLQLHTFTLLCPAEHSPLDSRCSRPRLEDIPFYSIFRIGWTTTDNQVHLNQCTMHDTGTDPAATSSGSSPH